MGPCWLTAQQVKATIAAGTAAPGPRRRRHGLATPVVQVVASGHASDCGMGLGW